MDCYRLRHTIGMCLKRSGKARAKYIKKHDIFYHMGENCMVMFRKIPLYPKLISVGDNVWIASNVLFITHDVVHKMLNHCVDGEEFREMMGCIEIDDNVFIGSNSTILPGVKIGPNTVIAAGSVVSRSIAGNGVYAGVPAKYIGPMQDFIAKRKNIPQMEKSPRGGLTPWSVEELWKQFRESGGNQSES